MPPDAIPVIAAALLIGCTLTVSVGVKKPYQAITVMPPDATLPGVTPEGKEFKGWTGCPAGETTWKREDGTTVCIPDIDMHFDEHNHFPMCALPGGWQLQCENVT